jgi:glycerophosphoryl diester phosphodiesterase
VTVISFHAEALRETREHLPDIPLVLVAGRSSPTAPERAAELGAGMVSLELEHVDEDVVQRARALGIKVISWTVNTDEDLARVRELGLDGVVTDMPAISRAVRALA